MKLATTEDAVDTEETPCFCSGLNLRDLCVLRGGELVE
jgi:hypothetical protein